MRTTADGMWYGGKDAAFYWDKNINANATISNGLANCTTAAYGMVKELGHPALISKISGASTWHQYLINGWMCRDYVKSKARLGDIIQWVKHVHVAMVTDIQDNEPYISGSFYTGEHGKAYYNKKFDTRTRFNSLKELSDWMVMNYPFRFFHFQSITKESSAVGGDPEHILVHPMWSVGENTAVDQIYVSTFEQNVRMNHSTSSEIVCCAEKGYHNVLGSYQDSKYTWYQVEDGWIAGVEGRVTFHKAQMSDDELIRENDELKQQIAELQTELAVANDQLDEIRRIVC